MLPLAQILTRTVDQAQTFKEVLLGLEIQVSVQSIPLEGTWGPVAKNCGSVFRKLSSERLRNYQQIRV